MKPFRFKAQVTLDPPTGKRAGGQYASGTHSLMVHARRTGQPSQGKYFPAAIAMGRALASAPRVCSSAGFSAAHARGRAA